MSRLSERIDNFNKSYELFSEMQQNYISDKTSNSNRLALTQSFEIIFELGWKIIKDYLAERELYVYTPKDVIKAAFSAEILPNAQIWIDMAKDRNASSHEYNQDKVDKILERISSIYFNELKNFKESEIFNG